uniref:putative ABC transporter permease n=1 Tax=Agathobacter sp. TaxID=2021311 RepID=UPI003FEDFABA
MMKWRNFFICGLAGWCMEIVFTSFGTFLHGDPRLLGHTSLWMFPIYGMAALIDPIYEKIKYWPFLLRGCFYAASIMLGEFLSGSLLRFLGVCPWDYSGTPYNIAGIVRLDYFPFWVVAGLAFEVLLRFLDERNSLSEDVSSRPHV